MVATILKAYGITSYKAEPLLSGLINRTWKVSIGEKHFILQQINDQVFKNPRAIADNIRMVDQYLKEHSPGYLFVAPLPTLNNEDIFYADNHGYFRLLPFINGSHTLNVVTKPEQAFEAAFQFGKFTRLLSGFKATNLHITIPDFHNLSLRFQQFEDALKNGNESRIKQSKELIDNIKAHLGILTAFKKIQTSGQVKQRVMHHDTKISNVLFNQEGKGICIIDLDTLMPGYFISDVGDMLRTYLSPANEEEKDFSAIEVRDEVFRAIVNGYVNTMGGELTVEEQSLILYSGQFLIYMQAIRFLTDYINNDIYYGARYEEHNFTRAGNQLSLLKNLEDKAKVFQEIVSKELQAKHYLSS
jgi:Ser/Thr protein kinase RdoA (MazF antagonist)